VARAAAEIHVVSGFVGTDVGVRAVIRLDADRETFEGELAVAARVDAELAMDPGVQRAVEVDLAIERVMARRRQGGG